MKLADYLRDVRAVISSRSGGWLALFSLGVGLSLLWSTVPLFLAPLMCGLGARMFFRVEVTVAYYAVFALVMGVCALGGTHAWTRRLVRLDLPHALVGVFGGLLLAVASLFEGADVSCTLGCAGAGLAAAVSACTLLASSRLLKRLSPMRAIIACTGAFIVCALLTVAAAFLDNVVAGFLLAAVPLCVLALSRLVDARVPFCDLASGSEGTLTLVAPRARDTWRYGAILLGLFLMGGFVLGYAGQYEHLPQSMPTVAIAAQSITVVILFALVAFAVQSVSRSIGYALICRVCVPAIAVATILLFIPEENRGLLDDLAVCLTFVALLLCDLMVWVVDVCTMRGRAGQDDRMFAGLKALSCLGVIGANIISSISWAPLDKPKVGMAIAFVMLIVTLVCLPAAEAKILPLSNANPAPLRTLDEKRRGRWSDAILERKLTAREAEVFVLMADGIEAASIARELGISNATVHTHVQHIYEKFDVHSRKELELAIGVRATSSARE